MMGAASPPPAAAIETAPKPAKEGMSKYERLAKKLADDEAKKADGRARGASFANKTPLYIKVFDIFSFFSLNLQLAMEHHENHRFFGKAHIMEQ